MILHENRLPADDSHEISCLYWLFLKKRQNLKLSSAANYRWCFKGKYGNGPASIIFFHPQNISKVGKF